jgi:hypothetical protein
MALIQKKMLPVPPGGHGGVVFESTSDLNWKIVNYLQGKLSILAQVLVVKSSLNPLFYPI